VGLLDKKTSRADLGACEMQSINLTPKKLSLVAGAGAIAVMGAVTFTAGHYAGTSPLKGVMADTPSVSAPPSTPTVPSAVPAVKATKFVGGDWTGM
jgi:hypothetical protein